MSEAIHEVFLVASDGTLENIGSGCYRDCIRLAFRKVRNLRRCMPEPIFGGVDDDLSIWEIDGGLCFALPSGRGCSTGRVLVMDRNSWALSFPFSPKLPRLENKLVEFEVVSTADESKVLFTDGIQMCKQFAELEVYRIKCSAPAYEGLRRRKTKFWHRPSDGALLCGFRQKGYDHPTAYFAIRQCQACSEVLQGILELSKGLEP